MCVQQKTPVSVCVCVWPEQGKKKIVAYPYFVSQLIFATE